MGITGVDKDSILFKKHIQLKKGERIYLHLDIHQGENFSSYIWYRNNIYIYKEIP